MDGWFLRILRSRRTAYMDQFRDLRPDYGVRSQDVSQLYLPGRTDLAQHILHARNTTYTLQLRDVHCQYDAFMTSGNGHTTDAIDDRRPSWSVRDQVSEYHERQGLRPRSQGTVTRSSCRHEVPACFAGDVLAILFWRIFRPVSCASPSSLCFQASPSSRPRPWSSSSSPSFPPSSPIARDIFGVFRSIVHRSVIVPVALLDSSGPTSGLHTRGPAFPSGPTAHVHVVVALGAYRDVAKSSGDAYHGMPNPVSHRAVVVVTAKRKHQHQRILLHAPLFPLHPTPSPAFSKPKQNNNLALTNK
ncbi:hypothetical protein B0H12DRAFT_1136322 [Mycena haematopus]|nr:hypothetical protein B0H12DRAFT_1136322 [Mycena haematopus]